MSETDEVNNNHSNLSLKTCSDLEERGALLRQLELLLLEKLQLVLGGVNRVPVTVENV